MWKTWQEAMQAALYGPGGFYARGERPAAHFRTSVHTSARYAAAVLTLLGHVDAALGQPAQLDVVDIGAGQGELLGQLLAAAAPPLAERIVPHAVEVAPRPPGLDQRIRWAPAPPSRITGLVIASEWLDNVPLDVAELSPDGPRIVLVNTATGAERSGPGDRPGRPGLAAPVVAAAPRGRPGRAGPAALRGVGRGDRPAGPRAGAGRRLRPPAGQPPGGRDAGRFP